MSLETPMSLNDECEVIFPMQCFLWQRLRCCLNLAMDDRYGVHVPVVPWNCSIVHIVVLVRCQTPVITF